MTNTRKRERRVCKIREYLVGYLIGQASESDVLDFTPYPSSFWRPMFQVQDSNQGTL